MTRLDEAHPVELLLLGSALLIAAVLTVVRTLVVPAVALVLVACGWRPAPAPLPEAPAMPLEAAAPTRPLAPTSEPPAPALEAMTVAALRRVARERGLPRSLTRSGRRVDLLEALAAA